MADRTFTLPGSALIQRDVPNIRIGPCEFEAQESGFIHAIGIGVLRRAKHENLSAERVLDLVHPCMGRGRLYHHLHNTNDNISCQKRMEALLEQRIQNLTCPEFDAILQQAAVNGTESTIATCPHCAKERDDLRLHLPQPGDYS
jgi:hypothetical protein